MIYHWLISFFPPPLSLEYSFSFFQLRTSLSDIAQLLRKASLQKTLDHVKVLESHLTDLQIIRKLQVEKEVNAAERDANEDDKLLNELNELVAETSGLYKELTMTVNDYKKKVKQLNRSLIDAMYGVQQTTLKNVERIPTDTFKDSLAKMLEVCLLSPSPPLHLSQNTK